MDWTFVAIVATLGIVGAALIAGGVVVYRDSITLRKQALGAAATAAGLAIWALILFITPVTVTGGI